MVEYTKVIGNMIKKHGEGKEDLWNGYVYVGEFKDDMKHGKGK